MYLAELDPSDTRDAYVDHAGERHAFARKPLDNAQADHLDAFAVQPALELANELDKARGRASARGLRGFELHEACATVRPRVHAALLEIAAQLTATATDLHRRLAEAIAPPPVAEQEALAAVERIPPRHLQTSIDGPRDNQAWAAYFAGMSHHEAKAILAAPQTKPPPGGVRQRAEAVWRDHVRATDPRKFEAFDAEDEAIRWAQAVVAGLVAIAAPPALVR